jgi:hypothetical protein
MSLDHGILNVPLAKRGNIDAQIDRYKAGQAIAAKALARAAAQVRREEKARAKALLAEVGERMVQTFAPRLGKGVKEIIRRMSIWEPQKFIKLAEKFKAEQAVLEAGED